MKLIVFEDYDITKVQDLKLPELQDNARYLSHPNKCYDWGTFGWALQPEHVEVSRYQYFVFLNSSVRGPFLPHYLKVRCALVLNFSSDILIHSPGRLRAKELST